MSPTRRYFFLFLLLFVAVGVAFGQTQLGNMFKLGHTTTAGRPTPSQDIKGALLYDTDIDAPIVSNGSSWTTISGGGGDTFWADAGVAGVAYGRAGAYRVGNPANVPLDGGWTPFMHASLNVMTFDGGPPLSVRGTETFGCPSGTCNHLNRYTVVLSNDHADPAIAFYGGTTGTTFLGAIATGLTTGGQFTGSLNFIGGSSSSTFAWLNGAGTRGASLEINVNTGAHTLQLETASGQPAIRFSNEARFVIGPHANAFLQASGGTVWTPAVLQSTAAASTTAISVGTTGAFLDVGGGAQDYFVSDGTSLSTPTNFGAARLSATQGLHLAASASPPTPSGAGHLYASNRYASDTGSNVFAYDGQNWRQLGQGKRWGVQKREMHVEVGLETTAPHTMRAPILDSSGGDSTWTCGDSGTVPVTLISNGRPFRRSATASTANSTAYCHTGSTAGTLVGVTQRQVKPNVCAWVRTDASVANVVLWWGLFNNFAGATIPNLPTSRHVAALRYSTSAGDTGWVLVTCNASACTTTPTGVSVSASRSYLLCVDASDDTGAVFAYVNEYAQPGTVVSTTSTLPGASTWLGFVHYVETLTASSNTFGLSHLSLETN